MKKLNDKQKKILNIVITSLQITIVLIAVILSAIIIANPNVGNAEIGKGNTKLLPVLTDSMKGDNKDSFNEGDLVIAKKPKDASSLEVGDIITYKITLFGTPQLNTHRIVEKNIDELGNVWFNTRGDNAPEDENDIGFVYASEVLAVYKSHLKGVGSAIHWFQKPTNFLLVIVLPLILLFIYNIILFVKMIMQAKLAKVEEEKDALKVDEEEIKRKAIEEFLATKKIEEPAKVEEIAKVEVKAAAPKAPAKKAPAKAPAKKVTPKKD